MSNHLYADGATHNDHHKEINIQGNVTVEALKELANGFFADAVEAKSEPVDFKEVIDAENTAKPEMAEMDLCHFIHPSVTDDKERMQIHREIENLVRCNTIPNICSYLSKMADDSRILLPIEPISALKELRRMGMPGEDAEGFKYKNFAKYYRK